MLDLVHAEPDSSNTKSVGRKLGTSQSIVNRIVGADQLHPYHLTPVQNLVAPQDPPNQLEFCQRFHEEHANNEIFVDEILWSDACLYNQDDIFDFHNSHHYFHENPHLTRVRRRQTRFSINAWTGMIGNF